MTEYFSKIPEIKFEGEESNNPFAFKFYDENKKACLRLSCFSFVTLVRVIRIPIIIVILHEE